MKSADPRLIHSASSRLFMSFRLGGPRSYLFVITYDRLCNLRSSYYINCWSPGMNAVAYAGFALR